MTESNAIPSSDNPVVKVGSEFRSVYLPQHAYDHELQDIAKDDRAAYGLAAVAIVAHGGPTGSHGLYWARGQQLHLEDGTIVAKSLAEAADLVIDLGWSTGSSIRWDAIRDPQNQLREASMKRGYLK